MELETATAEALEREAKARGLSLGEFLKDILLRTPDPAPADLEAMRAQGCGPWSPEALAQDARSFEEFKRTGLGVPFEEIVAWTNSWGTDEELPLPKPRRL